MSWVVTCAVSRLTVVLFLVFYRVLRFALAMSINKSAKSSHMKAGCATNRIKITINIIFEHDIRLYFNTMLTRRSFALRVLRQTY